jgi:hypothetical protein
LPEAQRLTKNLGREIVEDGSLVGFDVNDFLRLGFLACVSIGGFALGCESTDDGAATAGSGNNGSGAASAGGGGSGAAGGMGATGGAGGSGGAGGALVCVPFGDPDGCGAGDWCKPSDTDIASGACVADGPGTQIEGQDCFEAGNVCGPELVCLAVDADESYCARVCDPGAAVAEPGHCGASYACREQLDGEPPVALAWGACAETCEYGQGNVDCMGFGGTCVNPVLFGDDNGTCAAVAGLDEFADCTNAGVPEFDVCAESSLCLQIDQIAGPYVACYDMCATALGAFGTTQHPNCRRSTAVCTQLFQSDEFGVCQ